MDWLLGRIRIVFLLGVFAVCLVREGWEVGVAATMIIGLLVVSIDWTTVDPIDHDEERW